MAELFWGRKYRGGELLLPLGLPTYEPVEKSAADRTRTLEVLEHQEVR